MLLLKMDQLAVVISHAQRQAQFESAAVVEADTDIEVIDDQLLSSDSIEISLPAFSDGRGLSVARHLRMNKKYKGVLRATGNVLPDQLQSLFQLGFDEVLVGDVNLAKHSEQDWLDVSESIRKQNALLPSYLESVATGHGHDSIWSARRQ